MIYVTEKKYSVEFPMSGNTLCLPFHVSSSVMKIFLIFFFTCCFLSVQAQQTLHSNSISLERKEFRLSGVFETDLFFQPFDMKNSDTEFSIHKQFNHLPGLFCKMEYQIEKKSKLAPRFRLGSVNYTNWMEGKGAWYNRYRN